MAGPYLVLERNQASGHFERVADDRVCDSLDEAINVMEYCAEHAKALGRLERYRVFELVPTSWNEDDE